MVTVAIAGGAGHVGATLKDVLLESTKHKLIVLSRKAPEVENPEVPVIVVDYSDIEGVTKVLESNNVHTVISTIRVLDAASGSSELGLIKAAEKSSAAKRFVASNWGMPTPPEELYLEQHKYRVANTDELALTNLEWTQFYCGYFLDYFGIPHIKSHMLPLTFVVDMTNKTAAIPGTGNDNICFTYTFDLARFVVAALDLPKWEKEMSCYGDVTTWNEFVKTAEAVRGAKFNVTYDSIEKLTRGEVTELPSHPAIYPFFPKPLIQAYFSKFGLYIVNGLFDIRSHNALNEQFPDIKPSTVEEILGHWKGK